MSLRDKRDAMINLLQQQVKDIDKSIDRSEKNVKESMDLIEESKVERQATLSLLNEIRKIKA